MQQMGCLYHKICWLTESGKLKCSKVCRCKSETRRVDHVLSSLSLCLKAEDWCPYSKAVRQTQVILPQALLLHLGLQLIGWGRPIDWMRPIHFKEGNLLYSTYQFLCWSNLENIFTYTQQIMFSQIHGHLITSQVGPLTVMGISHNIYPQCRGKGDSTLATFRLRSAIHTSVLLLRWSGIPTARKAPKKNSHNISQF